MSTRPFLDPDFLRDLYAEHFGYRVTSFMQQRDYGASGKLVDTVEITFELTDHPGTFTVEVPYDVNVANAWRGPVGALADGIRAIYAL